MRSAGKGQAQRRKWLATRVRSGTCEYGPTREGIEVRLLPGDRDRLEGVVSGCKSPHYRVCSGRILLMTADGAGSMRLRRIAFS
jgi:hypothetical protein